MDLERSIELISYDFLLTQCINCTVYAYLLINLIPALYFMQFKDNFKLVFLEKYPNIKSYIRIKTDLENYSLHLQK